MKNTIKIILLIVVIVGTFWYFQKSNSQQVSNDVESGFKGLISAQEFNGKMKTGDYIVLDVRTLAEYEEQRILKNSTIIDFKKSNFKEELNKLDKNKKYLLHCRSGNRSGKAAKIMEQLGFKDFYELKDGMFGWNRLSLPTFSGK